MIISILKDVARERTLIRFDLSDSSGTYLVAEAKEIHNDWSTLSFEIDERLKKSIIDQGF